jgi:hypothetical protein
MEIGKEGWNGNWNGGVEGKLLKELDGGVLNYV